MGFIYRIWEFQTVKLKEQIYEERTIIQILSAGL